MWVELIEFFKTFSGNKDNDDNDDVAISNEPLDFMSASEANKMTEDNFKERAKDWKQDLKKLVINEISLSIGRGEHSTSVSLHQVDRYEGLLFNADTDNKKILIDCARSISDELVEMGYESEVMHNEYVNIIKISWNHAGNSQNCEISL